MTTNVQKDWFNENEIDLSDLEPKSIKIKNLLGKNYVLHEAGAKAGAKYRSSLIKVVNSGSGDSTDVKIDVNSDMATADLVLVNYCLFEIKSDQEIPVTMSFVESIPDPIFTKMVEWVKANSNLKKSDPKE